MTLLGAARPSFPRLAVSPSRLAPRSRYTTMHPTMRKLDRRQEALDFVSFLEKSPSPFHAVQSAKELLTEAGFEEIKERVSWSSVCKPGGKYYLTRNGSTIIAFIVGGKWKPGNGIAAVVAHTDSPVLRLKPVSKKQGEGFMQVGVETYGGGIWHTWFDRDLGVAGRVIVRDEHDSHVKARLVKLDRPILRIPTLAIHLDRSETFQFNKETQLFPIAGLVEAELNRTGGGSKMKEEEEEEEEKMLGTRPLKAPNERHHPYLVELIAAEAGVLPNDILDFELVLFDTQKPCLGGLHDEFVFSARLDNLGMSYCAVRGLIDSLQDVSMYEAEPGIRLVALFDNEEVGSTSAQGANSNILPAVLRRLSVLPGAETAPMDSSDEGPDLATAYERSLAGSFIISADMTHAVNPNYAFKYEADHKPQINKGPAIKINANQRYATNSPGIVLMEDMASRAGKLDGEENIPLQLFVVRNDSSCGSTIGPMLSASLGVRTVDLGNPQLSMHSIRETGGSQDVAHAIRLFRTFFVEYTGVESLYEVD